MTKQRIVLIDDEAKLLRVLGKALRLEGYDVEEFSAARSALESLLAAPPDLVVSDIRMDEMDGLELLAELARAGCPSPCMLMTAYSSMESAVAAVKLGARDYLLKPFEVGEFKSAVRRILHERPLPGPSAQPTIIGSSPGIQGVLDLVSRVAGTESTVFLQGESGTGKELVAHLLHAGSRRKDMPFIPVNCSAIPEGLVESELFGHVKGSFTGSVATRIGLFEQADRGTLFLDEIGDLALNNQAKLLRVLQDGSFKRIGDVQPRKVDVRIIAATNRDLKQEVAAGHFREDLLYRINVVEIDLPPLRDHLEDLPQLLDHFLRVFCTKHQQPLAGYGPDLLRHLSTSTWPGNVRELENMVERAVILKRGRDLTPADFPLSRSSEPGPGISADMSLGDTMEHIECDFIRKALDKVGWNYSQAAGLLGITRQNLHYKLKKYGLSKDQK